MSITVRKSEQRGGANHGWLNTKHTFSFADYYDPRYSSYGSLRVINEDHVAPGTGFPTHPHRDFEIFSYVIAGAIKHKDSMGNVEICKPGDIQFTSAGSGIMHSEFSEREFGALHFLQIWVKPSKNSLKPSYTTSHFSDEDKTNKLCLCLSSDGANNSIKINQDIQVYSSKLEQDHVINYTINPGRKVYIHLTETSGNVEFKNKEKSVLLSPGDGAFVENPQQFSLTSTSPVVSFSSLRCSCIIQNFLYFFC